jgi:hypothetical protein
MEVETWVCGESGVSAGLEGVDSPPQAMTKTMKNTEKENAEKKKSRLMPPPLV